MCSGCGKGRASEVRVASYVRPKNSEGGKVDITIVGKSKNPTVKVPVQYFGGGLVRKSWVASCTSCGGGVGNMSLLTSETIMFPSDDAPYGMFKQLFVAGRTYYVTENQAEYLLSLTFTNQAGQKINKFKRIEE